MSSFIFITCVLVAASVSAAGKSYADATFQMAGKSILSEYDRKLLHEYGLMCFRGTENEVTDKLTFYANGSFEGNSPMFRGLSNQRNSTDLLKLKLQDIDVNLKEYSMINVDLYEKQIKEALKMKLFEKKAQVKEDDAEKKESRTLRNRIIIDSLPSAGYKGSIFPDLTDAANIPGWEEICNSLTGRFARCEYALRIFKHANGGNLDKETFFSNEIEYILEGKLNDRANYRRVKTKLIAVRFALNAIYLISDKGKMAMITEEAALTGPAAPAVEAALFALWVGAETDNDIDLLENGENVAMIKKMSNWALNDLVDIIDGISSSGKAVKPADTSGQSYKDYLRVLLYLEDRESMLLRMMDLTQINMKGTYYRDFLLKEHYAGFRFSTDIKGDSFSYVEQY